MKAWTQAVTLTKAGNLRRTMTKDHLKTYSTVALICHGDEQYGVGTVIRHIAMCMPGIFYICMRSGPLEQMLRHRGEDVHVVNAEAKFVATSSLATLLRLPRAFLRAKRLAGRIEPLLASRQVRIVHVHWLPHQLIVGFLRYRGYLSLWHIHNNMSYRRLFGMGRWLNSKLAQWGANHILAVSEFISNGYRPSPVPRTVIHNAAEAVHSAPHSPEQPITCAVAGRLTPEKGHHIAVEAVLRARSRGLDVHLDVIGGPLEDNPYFDTLKRLVAKHTEDDPGAAEAIRFLGFRADLRQLTPNYHIALQCRIDPEPCGLWVCEAMVDGLPVIAADLGGPRELIVHGKTGLLIPPNDPDALTDALLQLAGDPDALAAMRQAAWDRGQEYFRLDRFARELDKLYSKLLANT
jgi:glycosyltransferase involved in cell wall biosynthesis